jgi:NNP family nitrate/nitrite transporter-like MFS transporter
MVLIGVPLLGLVAGFYLPSGIATLTSLVHPKHWGKAIAIHELGPNLSFLTAPLIAEALLKWFSWRGVLALLGTVAICLGLIFWRFGSGGRARGEAPRIAAFKTIFTSRGFWIMSFLFGLGISGTLGIFTMLTLFLVVERGLEQNWANMLIAVSRMACPAMVFLAGWSTDRLGVKGTMLGVFLLTGLTTVMLGLTQGPWLVAVIIIQPLLAASFFPAGFAALSMAVPADLRNVAVSITVPFGFVIGGGISPLLIGLAGDAGVFSYGIVLVGILIFAGAIISRYIPDT